MSCVQGDWFLKTASTIGRGARSAETNTGFRRASLALDGKVVSRTVFRLNNSGRILAKQRHSMRHCSAAGRGIAIIASNANTQIAGDDALSVVDGVNSVLNDSRRNRAFVSFTIVWFERDFAVGNGLTVVCHDSMYFVEFRLVAATITTADQ